MTTVAVIICDQERYRLIDTGTLQRYGDEGWQRFTGVCRDGVRMADETSPDATDEDQFYQPDIVRLVIDAADLLHFLYGWDISEVNLLAEQDTVRSGEGRELLDDLNNRSSLATASINFVGDEV